MAALYLGTSSLEVEMVEALNKSALANPDLKISLLFDYFRSTRTISDGSNNSTSAVNLLSKLADKANVILINIFILYIGELLLSS